MRIELIKSYGRIMPYKVIAERLFDVAQSVRKEAFQILKTTNMLWDNSDDLLEDLDFYEKDVHDSLINYYL